MSVYHYRYAFLTHPCRREPLKIFFISNDRGRSLFEAFDWLFICVDPCDVCDLRVKVVQIETPYSTVPKIVTSLVLFTCLMFGHYFIFQIYVFFNKIYLGIIEIIILKSYLSRNCSLEVSYIPVVYQ